MAGRIAALSLTSYLFHSPVASTPQPSAIVSSGTILGSQCPNVTNAIAFRGIPYAKPPVGNLRFAPPVAFSGGFTNGHLDATQDPPSCIQAGQVFEETGPTSEDCLYLNVYVPRNATPDSALPVRVWLYGGGNTDGGIANSLYDGCNVATHDAIMVSVNYRLGPFGFLALQGAGLTGNQALKDQILALRWVQENIRAFGGDAKRVMLHGQSAGALDAFILATLPEAPELFSSAIFESGAGREITTCSNAQKIGEAFARSVNCSVDDVSCLRSAPIKELVSRFETLPILNTGFGHFPGLGSSSFLTIGSGPSVDGELVKVQPSEAGIRVPSVIGYTSRDGALFAATSPAFANPLAISQQNYTAFLTQNFGATAAPIIAKHIPFSAFNGTRAPGLAAIEYVYTASEYKCPVYRALNQAVANGVDAYAYAFNHTPSCPWLQGLTQQELPLLGATHTSEIPFVLGHTESLPPPNGSCSLSPAKRTLSDFMVQAWTDMAASQAPASQDVWPRYVGGNSSVGVTFNDRPVVGPIDLSVCELFDQIRDAQIQAVGNGTGGCGSGSGSGNGTVGAGAGGGSAVPQQQVGNSAVALGKRDGGIFAFAWSVHPSN